MKLVQVPPEVARQVWPLLGNFLSKALEFTSDTRLLEPTLQKIEMGQSQLWTVIDDDHGNKALAAGVTSLQTYESGKRVCNIELFGGEDMKLWFDLKDVFEDWAKVEGCESIRVWARKGWAKHLKDYDLTHYILEKALHP